MKVQDVGFIITFLLLFIFRKEQWFLYAGLLCYVLAIPLFAKWIFFTAERLTWYGSGFIFVFLLLQMFCQVKKYNTNSK